MHREHTAYTTIPVPLDGSEVAAGVLDQVAPWQGSPGLQVSALTCIASSPFPGSVAAQVASASPVPVLILRAPTAAAR